MGILNLNFIFYPTLFTSSSAAKLSQQMSIININCWNRLLSLNMEVIIIGKYVLSEIIKRI